MLATHHFLPPSCPHASTGSSLANISVLRVSSTDLSNTWATCVGQYRGSSFFEQLSNVVSFDRCPNLFRPWRTEEGDLGASENYLTTVIQAILRPASSARRPSPAEPNSRHVSVRVSIAFGCTRRLEATMSSYELFVQEPMRPADSSSFHPFSLTKEANFDKGVAKSGVKGPLIVGSTLERSLQVVSRTSSFFEANKELRSQ